VRRSRIFDRSKCKHVSPVMVNAVGGRPPRPLPEMRRDRTGARDHRCRAAGHLVPRGACRPVGGRRHSLFKEGGLVSSQEVQLGTRVRVREGHGRAELRGLLGTLDQRWGNSDYPAFLVWLEDGRFELFWDYELEEAEEGSPID
jgi:hypothetical protein